MITVQVLKIVNGNGSLTRGKKKAEGTQRPQEENNEVKYRKYIHRNFEIKLRQIELKIDFKMGFLIINHAFIVAGAASCSDLTSCV